MLWTSQCFFGRISNSRSLVGRLSNITQQYQFQQQAQVSFPLLLLSGDSRRTILSSVTEPPIDSLIPERPATIILFEDSVALNNNSNNNNNNYKSSWLSTFQNQIPQQYGISFASIIHFPTNHTNNNGDDGGFIDMLESLKEDLSLINHETILITRGPLSSWFAVSYLESYPLQGLVMVNPIQLDHHLHHFDFEDDDKQLDTNNKTLIRWIRSLLLSDETHHGQDIENWIRLLGEAKNRKLHIEPGSVPMLIFCTEQFQAAANVVSQRHSDESGLYGHVPVIRITDEENPEIILAEIDTWVDNVV